MGGGATNGPGPDRYGIDERKLPLSADGRRLCRLLGRGLPVASARALAAAASDKTLWNDDPDLSDAWLRGGRRDEVARVLNKQLIDAHRGLVATGFTTLVSTFETSLPMDTDAIINGTRIIARRGLQRRYVLHPDGVLRALAGFTTPVGLWNPVLAIDAVIADLIAVGMHPRGAACAVASVTQAAISAVGGPHVRRLLAAEEAAQAAAIHTASG